MQILNPNNLPTLDYRTVRELQGDLKDLHHNEQEALHRILLEDGFDVPLFVWKNPKDSQYYLLDGHQRCRVMKLYDLNDNGNYEVPIIQFAATSEQAAKAKLLKITSQFGRITREGLDEYAQLAELDIDDMDIHFDAIVDFEDAPNEPEVEHEKPEKTKRWSLDELKTERDKYLDKTGLDDGGFVDYLAKR